ncbi:MAG TPA: hypothetical protein VJ043_00900 [Candidatus Paceibacterota bacterium]|nr:hypothetical protein [Candidatus Paceibacterota bacterium]
MEGPEKPAKRKFLQDTTVVGGAAVALGIGGAALHTLYDAKHKPSQDTKGIKEPERVKSKEEKVLDVQLNFLNELKASDDIALLALCKSGPQGFEELMRERIGLPISSSKITDSDPKSLAGRRLIGWYNRAERLNKGFSVDSFRTAIGLHVHDIEQELARVQKKALTGTPEN